VQFDRATDVPALTRVLADQGLPDARVQVSGRPEDYQYIVELQEIQAKVAAELNARFGEGFDQVSRTQIVGPKAGKALRNDGILAVMVSLVAMLFYIAVRFDFRYAPGAVLSLAHDVLITLGVYAIFSRWMEFSLTSVAAMLTITGYSINDTIIVYDRIRENLGFSRDKDLVAVMNRSVNETLSRTIWTSATTMFSCIALWIFCGGEIRGFAIAMSVGIVTGTYSSFAIASPLVLPMHDLLPKLQAWLAPPKAAGEAKKRA
jgi:preprotein translocase subunit SecF